MTDKRVALAPADVVWLAEPEQQRLLESLASDARPLHQLLAGLRREFEPARAALLLEQVELRQRAAGKFTAATQMLFTRTGYEQASDEWIAAYKAKRFQSLESAADLCCGIGGDTAALSHSVGRLVACDRDSGILALAEHNVGVQRSREVAQRVEWLCGDVTRAPLEELTAWHIDPDRRATGGRSTHTAVHEPSDDVIDQLLARNTHAAIKLAPACEPLRHWEERAELEWISRAGECRQLVAWFGALTDSPGTRRATLLPAADDAPLASVVGVPTEGMYNESIGSYCYECDPAVLAADLGGVLAGEYDLWQFAVTHGYLTGESQVAHPMLKGYAVEEVMPMQEKRVAAALRARGIGRLTIKHRGVAVDPRALAKRLKLSGDGEGTLIVTRQGERQIALLTTPLGRRERAPGL